MAADYDIPFDIDGNQQHYPESYYNWVNGKPIAVGPFWRPNTPFKDVITFEGFSRGRSAAYLNFTRSNCRTVTMFLVDLADAIPYMVRGKISGTFQFRKRGQNYGIRLLEQEVED